MLKKLFYILTVTICLTAILLSCKNDKNNYESADIFAMDTFVSILYQSERDEIRDLAETELKRIEDIFSKTLPDSEIYKLNQTLEAVVSEECEYVVSKCIEIAGNTDGAFNPAMGQIVNLWDVTGRKYVPADDEIASLLPFCSYLDIYVSDRTIAKKNPETHLDLGAAVKGYTAEKVIQLLKDNGIKNAMISIGGNIAVTGEAENRDGFWRVAIRNPFKPDEVSGYIDCTDKVISVSGDYERYFEADGKVYHHIFDYKTGKPADTGIKSVAVIAGDGLVSDALSTALFCMGTEKALDFYKQGVYDFEAVIFNTDGSVVATEGIKDEFTLYKESGLSLVKTKP